MDEISKRVMRDDEGVAPKGDKVVSDDYIIQKCDEVVRRTDEV